MLSDSIQSADRFLFGPCNLTWSPFAHADSAVAFEFANTTAKDSLQGIFLVSKELNPISPLTKLTRGDMEHQISIGRCLVAQAGRMMARDRIGVFTTTGGYSWTTIFYENAASSQHALAAYDQNVAVLSGFFGPVDAAGQSISSPPLVIHHGRVVPGPGQPILGMFPYTLTGCIVYHSCPVEDILLGGSGDALCTEEDGGSDCLVQHPMSAIQTSLTSNLQVNDLRPRDATPLKWFIELSVVYSAARLFGNFQLSLAYMPNLGSRWTYRIPARHSFDVLYARMPFGGTVMGAGFHSHAYIGEMTETSDAFAPVIEGSIAAWGHLESPGVHYRFPRRQTEVALLTTELLSTEDTGFATNDELIASVMREHAERVLCSASTKFVTEEGLTVARRSTTSCKQLHIQRGDPLTLITFVSMATLHKTLVNYHSHWTLSLLAEDGRVFRTTTWTTAFPDEASCVSTPADFIRLALQSYLIEDPVSAVALVYSHFRDDLLLAILVTSWYFRWSVMLSVLLAIVLTAVRLSFLARYYMTGILITLCVFSIRTFVHMESPIISSGDRVECDVTALREGITPTTGIVFLCVWASFIMLLMTGQNPCHLVRSASKF